jgi:hypothetical protein
MNRNTNQNPNFPINKAEAAPSTVHWGSNNRLSSGWAVTRHVVLTSRMPNQDAFTPQIWNLRIDVVFWLAVTRSFSLNHDVHAAVPIALLE